MCIQGLVHFSPLPPPSPLPPTPPPPSPPTSIPSRSYFALSIPIFISSTFTDVVFYHSVDALLFSFPSLLPWVPHSSSTITNMFLHMSLCMIMFVFVCMCVFWIYLPHRRENTWLLCFWAWLASLNMMSSNCIHLPSNHLVSLFFMVE
jgi:hypothetical protein